VVFDSGVASGPGKIFRTVSDSGNFFPRPGLLPTDGSLLHIAGAIKREKIILVVLHGFCKAYLRKYAKNINTAKAANFKNAFQVRIRCHEN
jgi:hypothetical protein